MYQIVIAATSENYTQENVKQVREFLDELSKIHDVNDIVLFLGGYWGLMKVIVDEALKFGFKIVLASIPIFIIIFVKLDFL